MSIALEMTTPLADQARLRLSPANASNTDWAELIAVFVADEGAQLTTLIEP
jgi:hypothetical protein